MGANNDASTGGKTEAAALRDGIQPTSGRGLVREAGGGTEDIARPVPSSGPWYRRAVRGVRDPFSGLSHLGGAVLSLLALFTLIYAARGKPLHQASFLIYGLSLIALYTASGLYHALRVSPKGVRRLQRLDYVAIFLLIAGTYAPVCLVTLHGPWGWSLLAIEYGLCTLGIVGVLVRRPINDYLRVLLYVAMAYVAFMAITPLRAALPPGGLAWLIGGGVVYSIGTVIFALDRPHLWPGRFSAHDLWHVCVLGGSACHFVLMLLFIAPARLPL